MHQEVADAEFFDKAQRLLARARPDGEHADHGSHSEDDSQSREQGADLLLAQALGRAGEVGEEAQGIHRGSASSAPERLPAFLDCCSGLASATAWLPASPVTTAWVSLRRTSFTSRGAKPEPEGT